MRYAESWPSPTPGRALGDDTPCPEHEGHAAPTGDAHTLPSRAIAVAALGNAIAWFDWPPARWAQSHSFS
ncbi:hypothetical protein C7402_104357 [Paraburkholderia unamae]|uniref:Uncharacterized protein n=1 Tax=Paraburkholderia unamae TaxID=219649 RepID=A0ABX5KUY7_9BURK|nr:hypothetical protein C7402_104357 [Paraburkholderia unamae]